MITSYYTMQALAGAWASGLTGAVVGDAYSQDRGELTLALMHPEAEAMLKASVQAPLRYVFRRDGYNKARRNVATLFENAFGSTVTAIRLADRDRLLYLDLDDGRAFQVVLFGPRANIFLLGADGRIEEAFQDDARLAGTDPPLPRPAPQVDTLAAFEARWRSDRKTVVQAVAAALPLFGRTLAAEVVHRAGLPLDAPPEAGADVLEDLFAAALAVRAEVTAPSPRIYWRGRLAEVFSLCRLHHLTDLEEEPFDGVDAAVRVFVPRRLGQQRFRAAYEPLAQALSAAHAHHTRSTERMLEELSKPSRADRYERWGHLLMAAPHAASPGADHVELDDLFEPGATARIPLDPRLDAIGNAERYYDKARRTRAARRHAEARLLQTEQRGDEAGALLETLRTLERYREVEQFRKDEAARLAPFLGQRAEAADRLPFRRYALAGGYEVWVGRNARQNDQLTFQHAQKYDLWMHARGVAGSHAVLRLPGRQAEPPRPVLEQAAAIAAYYSKARGSHLVPVIVVPRKHVRKPRGAAPGAVVVERETVLIVEPRLPQQ